MFLCLNASEPEAIFFSVNRKIWRARRVIGASLYNIMFHLYFLILKESLQNIKENKSMMYLYLFVLILSFTGVIITDSLINSVAKTAQSELRDEGNSIITINFHIPKSRYQMAVVLSQMEIKDMVFSKKFFFRWEKPHIQRN